MVSKIYSRKQPTLPAKYSLSRLQNKLLNSVQVEPAANPDHRHTSSASGLPCGHRHHPVTAGQKEKGLFQAQEGVFKDSKLSVGEGFMGQFSLEIFFGEVLSF